MIPGHDSACCVHTAEGAITSHHERTCLLPIVQRIISPVRSAPPARDTVRFGAVWPDHSDGPVPSMPSLTGAEIMPRPAATQPPFWRERGSAERRHLQIRKRPQRVVSMRAKSRIKPCLSANWKEGWRWWKSREVSMLSGSLQKMEDAWLSGGFPRHPVGPVLHYSLCQMNDGAINVYDRLDLKVGSIVPWSTELNVCLGAIKTSFVSVLHLNYRLIVGHFCPCFKSRQAVFVAERWRTSLKADCPILTKVIVFVGILSSHFITYWNSSQQHLLQYILRPAHCR